MFARKCVARILSQAAFTLHPSSHVRDMMSHALQAGPVIKVHIPEAYPGVHKGYAFCQYTTVVCMAFRLHSKDCSCLQLRNSNAGAV